MKLAVRRARRKKHPTANPASLPVIRLSATGKLVSLVGLGDFDSGGGLILVDVGVNVATSREAMDVPCTVDDLALGLRGSLVELTSLVEVVGVTGSAVLVVPAVVDITAAFDDVEVLDEVEEALDVVEELLDVLVVMPSAHLLPVQPAAHAHTPGEVQLPEF
jgi:hypothetical protein